MLKRQKKALIFIIFSLFFTQFSISNANDIIHIKDVNSVKEDNNKLDKNMNELGLLTISEFANTNKKNKKQNLSPKALLIIEKLDKIRDLQNKNNYQECLNEITKLYVEYPEYALFLKWKAFYENKTFNYEESNKSFEKLYLSFPFDKYINNQHLEINIYQIDNYRNLNDVKNFNETIEKTLNILNNNNNILINNNNINNQSYDYLLKNNHDIYKFMINYEKFMMDYENNNNFVDEKVLNQLWSNLSKKEQKNLSNYYGFDISDLEYIYGSYYRRKDVLKNYVKEKENAVDKKTIEKVQLAKRITFEKY